MKKIRVSAPGKLVLFGEHAVVYGRPCIVTAVDQRMYATAETLMEKEFQLDAPDVNIFKYKKKLSEIGKGDIPKGVAFVEMAVKNIFKKYSLKKGIKISTKSEFSALLGFGSSSASAVCAIKSLSEIFDLKLANREIFDLSFETVMEIQKKGSGIDIAASVYGGTLYYVTPGKIIESLHVAKMPLLIGFSGIKADTVTILNQVKERFKDNQDKLNEIYDKIAKIVEKAKTAIEKNDFKLCGKLMDDNQKYLSDIGVSIPKLDAMINGARSKGAYGAKLSGAGGGDCIVSFAPKKNLKSVENEIEKVGGEIIRVSPNAKGARVEI